MPPVPPARPAAALSPLQRLRGAAARLSPFAREISLILLIKFVLLVLIWWAFFSEPPARHMRIDPARVDQQLLRVPAADPSHAQR
jgi:hypothetical protein